MPEFSHLVQTIDSKVDSLIQRCDRLQDANAKLDKDNAALAAQLEGKQEEIEALNTKNKMLKVAGALSGDGAEQSEAKQKINELVREIDKCIALLNR
jgi:predicted  nucleic acid-binding Zn-ribbon protein